MARARPRTADRLARPYTSPAMNSRSSTGCGRPALASQVVPEVRSVLTGKLPNLHERGHRQASPIHTPWARSRSSWKRLRPADARFGEPDLRRIDPHRPLLRGGRGSVDGTASIAPGRAGADRLPDGVLLVLTKAPRSTDDERCEGQAAARAPGRGAASRATSSLTTYLASRATPGITLEPAEYWNIRPTKYRPGLLVATPR